MTIVMLVQVDIIKTLNDMVDDQIELNNTRENTIQTMYHLIR